MEKHRLSRRLCNAIAPLFHLLLWICNYSLACNDDDSPVIVIGGGLAGLGAAKELESQGCRVILLEATNRLGGRVKTTNWRETGFDNIDLGGTYIHGSSLENSLWWLASEEMFNLSTTKSGGTSALPGSARSQWWYLPPASASAADRKPLLVTEKQTELSQTLLSEFLRRMQLQIDQTNQTKNDVHGNGGGELLAYLRGVVLSSMQDDALLSDDLHLALLKFRLEMFFPHDFGTTMEELAINGFSNGWDYLEYAGEDHVFSNGTQDFIQALSPSSSHQTTKVYLETPVHRITYNDTSCIVEASRPPSHHPTTFTSNVACIVTIPLGHLKQHHTNMFFPPLPSEMQQALERTATASFDTLLVRWKVPLCQSPHATRYLLHNKKTTTTASLGPYILCPSLWRKNDPTERERLSYVTQFYIQGNDRLNDDTWKRQVVDMVREVHPNYFNVTIDHIESIHRTNWTAEPYTLGSYSYPSTLTRGNHDRRLLKGDVRPRSSLLYFAGEHTHTHGRYQSMDGAFDTGVWAAHDVVLGLHRRNSSSRTTPRFVPCHWCNPHQPQHQWRRRPSNQEEDGTSASTQ